MSFKEKLNQIIEKSAEASAEFFTQVKDKTKEATEKSVLNVEIFKLEQQVNKKIALLGAEVYDLLVEQGKGSVSARTPDLVPLLEEIKNLKAAIDKKQEERDALGKKEESQGNKEKSSTQENKESE
ncbi:hypothetical protein WKV44_08190 [Spirochaetia bacterium 38H-sp]|uniref:Uncharacterized protein n=1 Tax=Rarispira pelagica TaxID=3141764 RepID=A0ABU9UCX5_9SPIR